VIKGEGSLRSMKKREQKRLDMRGGAGDAHLSGGCYMVGKKFRGKEGGPKERVLGKKSYWVYGGQYIILPF